MDQFLKLVAEVGFPIAAACGAGYFVFLTLKFILAGVTSSVTCPPCYRVCSRVSYIHRLIWFLRIEQHHVDCMVL